MGILEFPNNKTKKERKMNIVVLKGRLVRDIENSGAVMGVSVTNYADSTAGSTADDEETIPF